jgi:hypothetical protein
MDVLPQIECGAVVSDPPYGMGYKSGPNSRNSISSTGRRTVKQLEIRNWRRFKKQPVIAEV